MVLLRTWAVEESVWVKKRKLVLLKERLKENNTSKVMKQQCKKKKTPAGANLLWAEGGAGSDVALIAVVAAVDTMAGATTTGLSPITETE
jgi:hypothetical protein